MRWSGEDSALTQTYIHFLLCTIQRFFDAAGEGDQARGVAGRSRAGQPPQGTLCVCFSVCSPPSLPPSLRPFLGQALWDLMVVAKRHLLILPILLSPLLPSVSSKVKKRDGTIAAIEKQRGFVDYHRNPDPYRDPLDRVFDWGKKEGREGGKEGGKEWK